MVASDEKLLQFTQSRTVCTSPADTGQDSSLKANNVNLMVALEEVRDHQSQ